MTAKIKLNAASGGGSFSLQAPSSSSNNRVFTLPDSADATILTSTASLGKILQVKQAIINSGTFSTSSTSFVDITGLSVDITPTSTSNKILIMMTGGEFGMYSGGAYFATVQLLRDSTELFNSGGNIVHSREGSGNQQANMSFIVLDSPNTTSAVTYKGQAKSSDSSKTVYVTNSGNGFPAITLMEVAA